nr:hypothetical protein [Tanacetum cinerariifolium]
YSSSDHFTSDDSSRVFSSETLLDSYSDASSDSSSRHSSSGHSISDSPCDSPTTISAWPSRKRRRSPTASVPVASPIPRALSPVRADLLSPRKRFRDSDFVTDFEADIDASIAFADDIAARETDVRDEVGTAANEEVESSVRGKIEIRVDQVIHLVILDNTSEPVREDYLDLVNANGSLERDQVHRIVVTSQQSAALSEMISTLERDNMRLRGMLGVERQRVDRLWCSMSYAQRDLRQIHRF